MASSNGNIYLKSAGTLQLDTSAKNANILNWSLGTGNVGIGTTGLGDKLHISGGNLLFDNNYGVQTKDTGGTARSVLL